MDSGNPSLLEVGLAEEEDEEEESGGGEEEGEERKGLKWLNTYVLDLKEAKTQIVFSFPMILTNVFYYLIPLVSVMFAGHLGELELAGATLANSWATVTGFAFMIGSSGALETLCGQAFGAKCYRNLGLYLQASCLISFFCSILISFLWFYTEPVLILLHQDSNIAKKAGLYMKFLIPGLIAYGFLQNIVRFLQTQSEVMPLLIFSALPFVAHIAIAYLLVNFSSMGFEGASLAASVTLWIAFLVLLIYVLKSKKFERTWDGFSLESFRYVFTNIKLAIPSAAMVCLEYWAFEILVLLAGLMPNPETTTSLIAMCVNTEAIAYMSTFGLSAAASTRVSNEMGAGNLKQAKAAMAVTLKLSLLLAFAIVAALGFGHNIWASLFSSSHVIIEAFASMTPFLVCSIIFDSIQGILSGAARGCGWQHFATYINLVTFYVVGMTIAAVLGFKFKLHAKGLWIGLISGLFCQTSSLAIVMLRGKWKKIELDENDNDEARKPLV